MKGKFIDFEGIDGSGTTTQAAKLVDYLFKIDKGNDILLTRNPTKHSPYGKELRRRLEGKLLEGEEVIHDPEYWGDLFINDRRWHNKEFVIPALNKGQQVICDRYKMSTIAYQSVQKDDIEHWIEKQSDLYIPDITFLLDLDTMIAKQRMSSSRENGEYFDSLEKQIKQREQYLKATKILQETENIIVIDGSQSIDGVAKAINREINLLYGYTAAK